MQGFPLPNTILAVAMCGVVAAFAYGIGYLLYTAATHLARNPHTPRWVRHTPATTAALTAAATTYAACTIGTHGWGLLVATGTTTGWALAATYGTYRTTTMEDTNA